MLLNSEMMAVALLLITSSQAAAVARSIDTK
jgi:hypothetical protein